MALLTSNSYQAVVKCVKLTGLSLALAAFMTQNRVWLGVADLLKFQLGSAQLCLGESAHCDQLE